MLRYIEWDDLGTDEFDLSGNAIGWGLNLSSNLKLGKANTLRLQVVYGEGIENYMNDATADIGIEPNPGDPTAPIKGVTLPSSAWWPSSTTTGTMSGAPRSASR